MCDGVVQCSTQRGTRGQVDPVPVVGRVKGGLGVGVTIVVTMSPGSTQTSNNVCFLSVFAAYASARTATAPNHNNCHHSSQDTTPPLHTTLPVLPPPPHTPHNTATPLTHFIRLPPSPLSQPHMAPRWALMCARSAALSNLYVCML